MAGAGTVGSDVVYSSDGGGLYTFTIVDCWIAVTSHSMFESGGNRLTADQVIPVLTNGKAPGRDNIHPEFVIHQRAKTTAWLCSFFTSCFRRSKLPKTWRRATVVALSKPNKSAHDPKSYRPISLLCVPFKILERLIHSRIDPVVDPQLPREQAGFRRGRSTVDRLLTQDIEDSFQHNEQEQEHEQEVYC